MKKRLLITSIVMMLVVAVALSTATYAWFTSNANVTANSVTMTASVSDAQSISIGWIGGDQQTSIQAVAGGALLPMCPTTSFVATGDHPTNADAYATTTNEYGIAFYGAEVTLANLFKTPAAKTPYTYQPAANSAENVKAFYINNDSNVQAVKIDVAATIANTDAYEANRAALSSSTILENGKSYYKKINGGAYQPMVKGTDYADNDTVETAIGKIVTAYNASEDPDIEASAVAIYSTKGVEDLVRVAVFATSEVASNFPTTVTATDYTYKCLLGKTANLVTAYGTITEGANASTVTTEVASTHENWLTTTSGTVIANLPAGNRVYIIVKVWLDGADFTQHEGRQAASVSLEFTASNANA